MAETTLPDMAKSLTRFPIRCRWDYHDAPAVVMLKLAFNCGCPEGETATCADCADAMPVGYAAKGRNQACLRCGTWPALYTIIGTRPLNVGDLPDAPVPHPAATDVGEGGA